MYIKQGKLSNIWQEREGEDGPANQGRGVKMPRPIRTREGEYGPRIRVSLPVMRDIFRNNEVGGRGAIDQSESNFLFFFFARAAHQNKWHGGASFLWHIFPHSNIFLLIYQWLPVLFGPCI
jgi:hypothetical protein